MPLSNSRHAQGSRLAASATIGPPNPVQNAQIDVAKEAADFRIGGTRAKPHPVDARSVQTILERSFRPGAEEEIAIANDAGPKKARFAFATTFRRLFKIALGLGLVDASAGRRCGRCWRRRASRRWSTLRSRRPLADRRDRSSPRRRPQAGARPPRQSSRGRPSRRSSRLDDLRRAQYARIAEATLSRTSELATALTCSTSRPKDIASGASS